MYICWLLGHKFVAGFFVTTTQCKPACVRVCMGVVRIAPWRTCARGRGVISRYGYVRPALSSNPPIVTSKVCAYNLRSFFSLGFSLMIARLPPLPPLIYMHKPLHPPSKCACVLFMCICSWGATHALARQVVLLAALSSLLSSLKLFLSANENKSAAFLLVRTFTNCGIVNTVKLVNSINENFVYENLVTIIGANWTKIHELYLTS